MKMGGIFAMRCMTPAVDGTHSPLDCKGCLRKSSSQRCQEAALFTRELFEMHPFEFQIEDSRHAIDQACLFRYERFSDARGWQFQVAI